MLHHQGDPLEFNLLFRAIKDAFSAHSGGLPLSEPEDEGGAFSDCEDEE